jgi:penicillin amidase
VPDRAAGNRLGIVDASDPATAWTGWLDPLPRHDVPPDGQVVTANERRGPESDPIGATFAPPHRAMRINELLDGRDGLTVADFAAIHSDVLVRSAGSYQDLIRGLPAEGEAAGVRDDILAWDGRMAASSRGAAAFAAWRTALTRRLAAEPVFTPLNQPIIDDPIFAPALDLTSHIGLALEGLVAARTPYGIDLRGHALAALSDAAGHPATWGETHVVEPVHAFDLLRSGPASPPVPPMTLSGDLDCVRCTASIPGVTDICARGSVARYVWDLADREAGGWVVPMGAAGAPGDPHHLDQLRLWAAAELAPITTDWDRLRE